MPSELQWRAARARSQLYGALRAYFGTAGYLEVETPTLVPTPGLEPHIDPFEAAFLPQTGVGSRRSLWLHTSPEYAMKRLLADGSPPIFQLCKTYRNGEISGTHNPEFTMLEFYRPHADYHAIMADLEGALAAAELTFLPLPGGGEGRGEGSRKLFSHLPYERLTVRDAVLRHTGIDLFVHSTGPLLKQAATDIGVHVGESTDFDDVFFHVFLERVERKLGIGRPTFLIEYPASMASLSRLKPGDPRVAERVELYADGMELANGFSELTDAREQRKRLMEEQALRRSLGRPVFDLDERFLEALPKMPPAGGIAVGIDRVLMLLLDAKEISDVLLFPARDFV